jgi:spermidine synthase
MNFARWLWRKTTGGEDEVYITERFGVRSLHIGSDTIQSSMRLLRPNDLELAYTRSMMAFLLFNGEPRRILMIGLGGGSLAKFVYHRMPEASLEVIEVNPRVLAIARSSFNVPADDGRFIVRLGDGAEWVARPGPPIDAIVVDGYDGASQVAELSTPQFYEACRHRLAAGGMLVVNLWGNDRRFDEFLRRIESAFPGATLCLPAEKPGNVIVFGFRDSPGAAHWDALAEKARVLEARYGLEFGRFVHGFAKMNRSTKESLFMGPAPAERRQKA